MTTWISVSNAVLTSEFPACELRANFSVFNLNANAQDNNFDDTWRALALEKLANAVGQNPTDVKHHVSTYSRWRITYSAAMPPQHRCVGLGSQEALTGRQAYVHVLDCSCVGQTRVLQTTLAFAGAVPTTVCLLMAATRHVGVCVTPVLIGLGCA